MKTIVLICTLCRWFFVSESFKQYLNVSKWTEAISYKFKICIPTFPSPEGLSSFEPEYLKKLLESLPPDSPPAALDLLIDQIKARIIKIATIVKFYNISLEYRLTTSPDLGIVPAIVCKGENSPLKKRTESFHFSAGKNFIRVTRKTRPTAISRMLSVQSMYS